MINILPDRGLSEARKAYRVRLASLMLLMGAFGALAIGALLAPSYFDAYAQERAMRERVASMQGAPESDREGIKKTIMETEAMLISYEPFIFRTKAVDHITAVSGKRGTGITLQQFAYTEKDATLLVVGEATTRGALLSFERALKEIPQVASVVLPVSNLARSEEIRFSITVVFKKI